MTPRELVDALIDDPKICLMGVTQVMRSLHQREPATFEGNCASAMKFVEIYGLPSKETFAQFLQDMGDNADKELRDEEIMMAVSVND